MRSDPIIDEVRHIRCTIETECDVDPIKYYEHLLELQENYRGRLVRLKPKPAMTKHQLAG